MVVMVGGDAVFQIAEANDTAEANHNSDPANVPAV
jgi:hypothetical protein